MTFSSNSG